MVVVAVVASGFVLLGVSAARHARWRDAFAAQLRAQALWHDDAVPVLSWAVLVAEAVVGGGGVLVLSFGAGAFALGPFLMAMALLGAGFVGLQAFLLVRRPDAPCGCDPGHDAKVGVGTLLKAAWPALAGVLGLVALPAQGLDALTIGAALVAVVGGLALAALLDRAPALFDAG